MAADSSKKVTTTNTRAPSKPRKPKGSLNPGVILTAAKKTLKEQGVEALSIRNIASELGCGTMSIYNHYSSKQQIIADLVADFVKRAHQGTDLSLPWKQQLQARFQNIYNATISEPEYLTLMIDSHHIGVASYDVFESMSLCLAEAGFDDQQSARILYQLLSFTLGAALLQVKLNQESRRHDASALRFDADYFYQTLAEQIDRIQS